MNPEIPVTTQPLGQLSYGGGINTSAPPELIGEDEAVDILNFEFDKQDHLIARAGIHPLFTQKFSRRITSIHQYRNDLNDAYVLFTTQNRLYTLPSDSETPTDITDTLVLPNNTIWQWVNYAGFAIGVNQATTGDNPIKVTGSVATATALGGTPPKAKYITVWNERVWIVDAENPNTIHASALGDPEDWTDTGADGAISIDLGKNDGDLITGLIVFQGSLYVFKRKKIYVIKSFEGANAYDAGNLTADEYSSNTGCIAANTIKQILNDVLFLSESGVCSLVSAPLGQVETRVLSQKVKELKALNPNPDIFAYVHEQAQQYWLMVPDTSSTRGVFETYVMDYSSIERGKIRWVRFDGKIAGTYACSTLSSDGEKLTLIASQDKGIYFYRAGQINISSKWDEMVWDLSVWDDESVRKTNFDDGGVSYKKQLITRAFRVHPIFRMQFDRFAFNLTAASTAVRLTFNYFFDKRIAVGGTYIFDYTITESGAVWDEFDWDEETWDSSTAYDFTVDRPFKYNEFGRKYNNVSFNISNDLKEGFTLRELILEVTPLNRRQANDIGRII